jgi:hypothetical protein
VSHESLLTGRCGASPPTNRGRRRIAGALRRFLVDDPLDSAARRRRSASSGVSGNAICSARLRAYGCPERRALLTCSGGRVAGAARNGRDRIGNDGVLREPEFDAAAGLFEGRRDDTHVAANPCLDELRPRETGRCKRERKF